VLLLVSLQKFHLHWRLLRGKTILLVAIVPLLIDIPTAVIALIICCGTLFLGKKWLTSNHLSLIETLFLQLLCIFINRNFDRLWLDKLSRYVSLIAFVRLWIFTKGDYTIPHIFFKEEFYYLLVVQRMWSCIKWIP